MNRATAFCCWAVVFLAYVGGGVPGSFCDGQVRLCSLLLGILVAIIAVDLRRPPEL